MASVNRVFLIGHLGKEPELRTTQGGSSVCNLTLATDESYTGRDGNRVERTEWHRVTAFAKHAENCANYLHKGSLVFVEGSLQTRKWQDQSGQDRYTTEIKADRVQFLDRKPEGGDQQQSRQRPQQQQRKREAPASDRRYEDNSDVPF